MKEPRISLTSHTLSAVLSVLGICFCLCYLSDYTSDKRYQLQLFVPKTYVVLLITFFCSIVSAILVKKDKPVVAGRIIFFNMSILAVSMFYDFIDVGLPNDIYMKNNCTSAIEAEGGMYTPIFFVLFAALCAIQLKSSRNIVAAFQREFVSISKNRQSLFRLKLVQFVLLAVSTLLIAFAIYRFVLNREEWSELAIIGIWSLVQFLASAISTLLLFKSNYHWMFKLNSVGGVFLLFLSLYGLASGTGSIFIVAFLSLFLVTFLAVDPPLRMRFWVGNWRNILTGYIRPVRGAL